MDTVTANARLRQLSLHQSQPTVIIQAHHDLSRTSWPPDRSLRWFSEWYTFLPFLFLNLMVDSRELTGNKVRERAKDNKSSPERLWEVWECCNATVSFFNPLNDRQWKMVNMPVPNQGSSICVKAHWSYSGGSMWANNLPKHFILFFTFIFSFKFHVTEWFLPKSWRTLEGAEHLYDCMYSSRLCCIEKKTRKEEQIG